MNREGIQEDQLLPLLDELKKYPSITVEGVMSHLYSADETEYTSIEEQIKKFKTMYHIIIDYGHAPLWRHIGNSAGIAKINDALFNAYRPGIALYGHNPLQEADPAYKKLKNLRPVLSVYSRVISTQIIWPGDGVGYNHKYRPYDRELAITIPFGYAEGLPRNVSGNWEVKWKRTYLPLVGTICMNLCTAKMPEADAELGDEIELIGS